jgi:hypothetical protein
MDGQLIWLDALFGARLGDQLLGQLGAFSFGDHPAHHVAAEDVQDDIEIEVGPLARAVKLGNVPAPQLIRAGGQQFRLGVGRMPQLVAPFACLIMLCQDAIHRAPVAEIATFVQQRGIDFTWRLVLESLTVQHLSYLSTLLFA